MPTNTDHNTDVHRGKDSLPLKRTLVKIVTRLLLSFSLSTLLFAYLQAPDVAEVMMSALRRAQS
jgi:hypothetical protein